MKHFAVKSLLSSVILLALSPSGANAQDLCGERTIERQAEVTAGQDYCMTDYGHYFWVTVPYDNSNVTIKTSGGTFSGIDADIILYSGSWWSSGEEEAQSTTKDSNDETLSFVSRAGKRYFRLTGNISQTNLLVTVEGGDVPPPLGDYIVFDTNISVSVPSARLTSKVQYADVIATVLAAEYSDFKTIAAAQPDPITDVAEAVHFLAQQDDIKDADLNQLLYFLGSYKYYADAMTTAEAQALTTAMQAVAKMTGFLSHDGGAIQEGWAKALNNFERNTGSTHYAELLPHLLALLQYYSVQTNPFSYGNFGDSTMGALNALESAAGYGDDNVTKAFNDNVLDVMSVLRSFAFLGETAFDGRWDKDDDKVWIIRHSFNALGKLANIVSDEAKARIDGIIIESHDKAIAGINTESVQTIVSKNFLKAANRECSAADALSNYCIIPPKESDILTVTHQCTDKITIRAQATMTQDILTQSCAEMATLETEFHSFFNTGNTPVANDQNVGLEVVVFASPDDYTKYAGEFFGISTDNGGMYLEGTPETQGNQARFIAKQCPDSWVGNSCQYQQQIYNLKHEFVHYLDGRYNKAGGFNTYDHVVSWTEGMAEYLANFDSHTRTLNDIKGKTIPPLYNLLFMAYGYDDLYQWSYFAMRYLREQHPGEITTITQALRAGDKDQYTEVLKGVASRTQAGFEAFVLANSEATAPADETIPAANTIGECALHQQYVRPIDSPSASVAVTNTTNTPVSLFWINNNTGKANFDKNYKTLGQGDSFNANWSQLDRLMLTDNNLNCLGVTVQTESSNNFTIEQPLVKDVVAENIPALNQIGQCDLMKAHIPGTEAHEFTVTNTTDYPVSVFRVDSKTGKPIYTTNYGTLQQGESYTADFWFGNRRVMLADSRLNCLGVAVLDQTTATFTIDEALVANAPAPEVIPAANTIGSCDLVGKHLVDTKAYEFSITNTTDTPVNLYRVNNETGEPILDNLYQTLNKGESYTADFWFGKRRVMIADSNNQCLGVAVLTQADVLNDFQIDSSITGEDPVTDTDGDGVADNVDAFPNDPAEWQDSDSDGHGDNGDAFPNDSSEWLDSDGDGYGNNGDAFPNDASEHLDSDGDGYGDNADIFPNDATEWLDSDGDGIGDNSDPTPNGGNGGNCGAVTKTGGALTLGNNECVSGGRGYFYVWVDADNTTLTFTTSGGDGDVNLYYNADTWALSDRYQAASTNAGNSESLTVTANRGWRYITLDSSTSYSGVTLSVQ